MDRTSCGRPPGRLRRRDGGVLGPSPPSRRHAVLSVLGPDGAGRYMKMVYNSDKYAEMVLIVGS